MRTVRITHANWVSDWLAGDAGAIRYLTDEQAYEAVEVLALAVYTDGGAYTPPPPPQAIEVVKIEPTALADSDIDDRGPVIELDDPEVFVDQDALEAGWPVAVDPEPAEIPMPTAADSKARWIRWAMQSDPALTAQKAAVMTKANLMNRYGERL